MCGMSVQRVSLIMSGGGWSGSLDSNFGGGASSASTASGFSSGVRKHALHSRFHFLYQRRYASTRTDLYGSSIKEIGTFGTVEDFWSHYTHLVRPNDLPVNTNYYLFRDPIQPLWEDPANKSGGRWTIRLKKKASNRIFEDMAIALIGEQYNESDIVCGIALSVRFYEDLLSLWTRNAEDLSTLASIRNVTQNALDSVPNMMIKDWEFKQHGPVKGIGDDGGFGPADQDR